MKQDLLIILTLILCSCRYDMGGDYQHLEAFDVHQTPVGGLHVRDIPVSDGYVRVQSDSNSWGEYLQALPLYYDTVRCYNGQVSNQNAQAYALVDIEIGTEDLQQCADAVIRLRSEYLYHEQRFNEIHYNFSNGFKCSYERYAQGKRVCVLLGRYTFWLGNKVEDYSYPTFRRYLDQVYRYAGTASMVKELKVVPLDDIQIGDVLIRGGFPGHAMLVVDMAVHPITGDKQMLVAQGFTPAQNIHLVKADKEQPWFSIKDYISGDSINFLFNIKQIMRWDEH